MPGQGLKLSNLQALATRIGLPVQALQGIAWLVGAQTSEVINTLSTGTSSVQLLGLLPRCQRW